MFNAKKYMKSTYEQVNLIGKKTHKTAIAMEHLAFKCHWTEREAVLGNVIPVYPVKPKKEAQEL